MGRHLVGSVGRGMGHGVGRVGGVGVMGGGVGGVDQVGGGLLQVLGKAKGGSNADKHLDGVRNERQVDKRRQVGQTYQELESHGDRGWVGGEINRKDINRQVFDQAKSFDESDLDR